MRYEHMYTQRRPKPFFVMAPYEVKEAVAVEVTSASVEDAAELLQLQKLAYQKESQLYGGYQIPPLVETLEQLKEVFKTHAFFKVTIDGKIIGSVRVLEENGTCHIGRLMVHPSFQKRGIGTQLLLEVEHKFALCRRFELFTGDRSVGNIRLYEKLGYKRVKEGMQAGNVKLVYLEKTR